MTKGPLVPKNCLVDVSSPCLPAGDPLVLLEVVVERGDVDESLVCQHARAHALCELLDLLFEVGEESVQAPAADQRECVGGLLGLDLLVDVGEESV